eukprot:GHRQ01023247.1.p1 GENE.GHRQ01023247.1~~GHRQ01023247.1.p1  ORF type:complete len:156 (+),score=35.28 GHRQ01023247.1:146-613(+)
MFRQSSICLLFISVAVNPRSCTSTLLSAIASSAAASVAQGVVSASAAVALLFAPPALAFGPVSVKLNDIDVQRVECAGGRVHGLQVRSRHSNLVNCWCVLTLLLAAAAPLQWPASTLVCCWQSCSVVPATNRNLVYTARLVQLSGAAAAALQVVS